MAEKKIQRILDVLKPGDVINTAGVEHWFSHPFIALAYSQIRVHQKHILYNKQLRPTSYWMDTHTVQYFPSYRVFSMQPPKGQWINIELYLADCVDAGERISVLRYVKPIEGKLLCDIPEYITIMEKAADQMVGVNYAYEDLCFIALNRLLGYDWKNHLGWLDWNKKNKVCSTAIRTNFEYLRKKIEPKMTRLFDKLNRDYWTGKEYAEFDGVDVEETCPALYNNSKFFDSEFKTIITS
ncbi:MAG: hypothetical protein PHP92_04245 [Candidatus Nanoarchaeia archaeon]|nr:hypothetical protein [Candidatus Nanoarchaeia archaeon]